MLDLQAQLADAQARLDDAENKRKSAEAEAAVSLPYLVSLTQGFVWQNSAYPDQTAPEDQVLHSLPTVSETILSLTK